MSDAVGTARDATTWPSTGFIPDLRIEERREVIANVREDGALTHRYLLLSLASAAIAILGLLQNSVAVIIGAMLVAPLMGPILALGFAIATGDSRWMRQTATTLLAGVVLSLALIVTMVWLSPIDAMTSEIEARTRPTLLDLGVALFSAVAGAYATIRGRQGTIIGVAIATALMPPLGVVGYGIATGKWDVAQGAALLFVTNLLTIALTAALTARIYGFSRALTPKQTGLQVILIVTSFAALAAPLFLSLRQIANETATTTEVDNSAKAVMGDGTRIADLSVGFDSAPLTVQLTALTPRFQPDAEDRLRARLEARLDRPVAVSLSQYPLGATRPTATAPDPEKARAARRDAIRADVALLTGGPAGRVLVDSDNRRIGAAVDVDADTAADYQRRLAERFPDWTIRLWPRQRDDIAEDDAAAAPSGEDGAKGTTTTEKAPQTPPSTSS